MLQDLSCGKPNINRGKIPNQFSVPPDFFGSRNHVPWIIIGVCYALCLVILLIIRWYLVRENKRRDDEPIRDDPYDNIYVERTIDGVVEKLKVAKVELPSSSPLGSSYVDCAGIP